MPTLTVRNLPDDVHSALRVRAAQHGRSMEDEVHEILKTAVATQGRVKLGSLLVEIGRQARLRAEEAAVFDMIRERTPACPIHENLSSIDHKTLRSEPG